jgi:hypothetical protein
MAKKKNNTAAVAAAAAAAAVRAAQADTSNVVNFVLPGEEDDEDIGLRDDVLEDLEKIDESHGGGITWEVYCDSPLDKSGQIGKLTRSELRGLRDRCLEFGPGEYHVVARATNGKFVTGTRRNIKISGLVRGPTQATPAGSQIDPLTLMQMMEERAEKRRAQASRERMDGIKFWAPILAPIGVEMAKGLFGRGGSGESIKDMVAAMVGMKDLVGGGDKSIDSLLKGIELAQSLAPEGAAKGSTWSDVVTNALKELRPLAESMAQRRQPTTAPATPQLQFVPTPATSAAGAATTPAAPAGSSLPAEGDDMFKMFEPLLRKLAGELEEYAVAAADPGLAADALLVKVPRMVRERISSEQINSWLKDPSWWELLSTFHPTLQPYQAYCDQVREEILAAVNQPEDDGPANEKEA